MAHVIVLDTRVLIVPLDGEDGHHAAAETLLTRAMDDDLGATSLTLAEVLVVPVPRTPRFDAGRVLLAAEDAVATVASLDERLVQAAEKRNLPVLRGDVARRAVGGR